MSTVITAVAGAQFTPMGVLGSSPLGLTSAYTELVPKISALEQEKLEFVIRRLVVREGFDEAEAQQLRIEFLRFISLKFVTTERLNPSQKVDEFWHAFIVHTEEYIAFCNRNFGYYVHHRPQDHARKHETPQGGPAARTRELIVAMYPDYSQDVWTASALCDSGYCDS
jgi:hypothetical protein